MRTLISIWTYIKADQFFPAYLPDVKNYKRKISKGNPIDFSDKEKKQIKAALKKLVKDYT